MPWPESGAHIVVWLIKFIIKIRYLHIHINDLFMRVDIHIL